MTLLKNDTAPVPDIEKGHIIGQPARQSIRLLYNTILISGLQPSI